VAARRKTRAVRETVDAGFEGIGCAGIAGEGDEPRRRCGLQSTLLPVVPGSAGADPKGSDRRRATGAREFSAGLAAVSDGLELAAGVQVGRRIARGIGYRDALA